MKKLFITALVLGIGFSSQAQKEKETKETQQDTLTQKANYNTTRSNKKSITDPNENESKKGKTVKIAPKSKEGGKSAKKDFHMILERKKMK